MHSPEFGGARSTSCVHPALASMSSREVERLLSDEFRRRGFTVTGFGGALAAGSAGGGNIALMKTGERFLVECKHWRKQQVDVIAVRELSAAIRAVSARGGYLFTVGEFTREARVLARISRVELIGGASGTGWFRAAIPSTAPEPQEDGVLSRIA